MLMVWLLILSLLGQLSVCSTVCEVQGLQGEDHQVLPNTGKTIIIVLVLGISTGTATKHHTNDSDFYFIFLKKDKLSLYSLTMYTSSAVHPPPHPSDSDSLLKELQGPGKYGAKLEKLEKMGWEEGGVISQVRNFNCSGDRDKHREA